MSSHEMKRISIKAKNPNPLFEKWLIQWINQTTIDEASKRKFCRALKALRRYPLPLESGRECNILKGFNLKICTMLDEKLNKYKANGNSEEHSISPVFTLFENNEDKTVEKEAIQVKDKGSKEYVPKYRSGGYAILIALYAQSLLEDYPGFLTKAEIIKSGKDLIDSSFTKPDPGSRYTAWSSMSTLISKRLVSKVSSPAKFSLTIEGQALAKKLYEQTKRLELDDSNKSLGLRDQSKSTIKIGNGDALGRTLTNKSYNITINLDDDDDDDRPLNCKEPQRDNFQISSQTNRLPVENGKTTCDNLISTTKNSSKAQEKICFKRFASSDTLTSFPSTQSDDKLRKCFAKSSSESAVSLAKDLPSPTLKGDHSSNLGVSSKENVDFFIMMPYSFDIILYVDNNETSGSLNLKNDNLLQELDKSGVKYEVKDLKIGDFTWICRDRSNNKELVLPYIIERKRMDDFAQSIKDRRYYEQKFRLKKSGIENLTYLVENYGTNKHLCLSIESLRQAATNTAIQENFYIKCTKDYRETAEYLVNFTEILERMFKSKTLASCHIDHILPVDINSDLISLMIFTEFNLSAMKNKKKTVSDLFVKMLIQIRGMSVERALAIIQQYPTPYLLKEAYESNDSESTNENLLSGVKYGRRKKIGPALSKVVYRLFCKLQY